MRSGWLEICRNTARFERRLDRTKVTGWFEAIHLAVDIVVGHPSGAGALVAEAGGLTAVWNCIADHGDAPLWLPDFPGGQVYSLVTKLRFHY